MKYFLYRHIRLDKDEPFYIGVGTEKRWNTFKSRYPRAHVTAHRSELWHNIAKYGYEVDIIFHSESRDEIFAKEKEFIALYGRIDMGTGILCNFTDGGVFDYSSFTKETKSKKNAPLRIKVYQYTLSGEYVKEHESIASAARELDLDTATIHEAFTIRGTCKGHQFFKEFQGDTVSSRTPHDTKLAPVVLEKEGERLFFPSITAASKAIGRATSNISRALSNPKWKTKGYSVFYQTL